MYLEDALISMKYFGMNFELFMDLQIPMPIDLHLRWHLDSGYKNEQFMALILHSLLF